MSKPHPPHWLKPDAALTDLPDSCLEQICGFLAPAHLCRLALVDRLLAGLTSNDVVWCNQLARRPWQRVSTSDLCPAPGGAKLAYRQAVRREFSPLVLDLGSRSVRVRAYL